MIEYTVVRTSRKTVSVTVKSDNSVIVRCPKRMAQSDIEKFVSSKRKWILKHISENTINSADFCDIIEGRAVLVAGKKIPIEFCSENKLYPDCVRLKSLKFLKDLLINELGKKFIQKFNSICAENGLYAKICNFKNYKSRWGCCNARKEITFSYKILMLPDSVADYVICHEICHIVYFDHSKEFWNMVESIYPDLKSAKTELKRYSFLTRLY